MLLTSMLTRMTKIAVRRPRPIDYVNCGSSETAPGGGLYDRHESTAVVLLGARIRRRGDERDGHVSGVRSQRHTFSISRPTSSWVRWPAPRSASSSPISIYALTSTKNSWRLCPSGSALLPRPMEQARSTWGGSSDNSAVSTNLALLCRFLPSPSLLRAPSAASLLATRRLGPNSTQ
jgi:hypothetical protein